MKNFHRILILSPHTDDGELSAGGTITKCVDQGLEVYYVGFSSCELSVPDSFPSDILKCECQGALKILGIQDSNIELLNFEVRKFQQYRQEILDKMILILYDVQPDLVICPSSFDVHQDHIVIHDEAIRAFKKSSSIWGMEHPWNNLSFKTDIFVDLNEDQLDKKIHALHNYSSQSIRDYFKEEYVRACAYTRGMNVGVNFAEVFECIRMRM